MKRTAAAGLPVALHVEGEARPLPAGVDLTAYRVLQAALGGALEHGGAGRAEVTVRYGAERVEVEVLDDGSGDGDGRLLLGARERVALYGGDLEPGATRGGHAVRARLPVGAALVRLPSLAARPARRCRARAGAVRRRRRGGADGRQLEGPLAANLLAVADRARRWPSAGAGRSRPSS